MATVNNHVVFFSGHKVSPPTNPISYSTTFSISPPTKLFSQSRKNHKVYPVMKSIAEDKEVVADEQNGSERESGVVGEGSEGIDKFASKAINASIVLGFGTLAVTRLLTIDHEYWHCYEGKPLFEFDRIRLFRSGLVGFTLHGSLSHYYYQLCEALIPFKDWWVVPAKIAFDQTVWSAVWNSIYFVVLGLLRFESPANIFNELKTTFLPLLTAGWKLWPFAHLVTYGLIPVEQRLLWVDCVELVWVTILSTYSNEKSETRISDTSSEVDPNSPSKKH
ncbi:hypothetical protein HanIR_Chr10g0471771 [Helianthus annuus]|uniref:protein sym-1 isoform X2 n=1 Tax=Helianthus annuus TaxID=4232 RepID=UPI001652FE42|nr:protein sym-1 isoform X2 [Helianthus annuus]KAJ0521510.1 hypothetical protein HanIR_Chr10g0471771 [Helianthus annuus]